MSSYHNRKMLSIDMSLIIVSCILGEFIPLHPCITGFFRAVRFLFIAIIFAILKISLETWQDHLREKF